jgi:hypothetical protein
MRSGFPCDHPVEYLILMEPRPDGPVIGTYDGHPIPAAVRDYFGRRFIYVGIASRLGSGRYDVTALSPGEWFVHPGMVYRIEAHATGGILKRFRKPRENHGEEHETTAP